ncbi:unannotated protein [freshwater metagenome]|uniref:Unannotated protein n=1 Tax=freshwater metagenome TaxID=449393 RepID=A0A6J6S135_9ZZZZ
MAHPLQGLGVGDEALVHPVAVSGAARLDLLDVGVDLALLRAQVVDQDSRIARLVVELLAGSLQLGDLRELGQGPALVPQLVHMGVELLEVEQLELGGGIGFQGVLLVVTDETSTGRCTAC